MKKTLILILGLILTIVHAYFAIPYGWELVSASHNHIAGELGMFLIMSPLITFSIAISFYIR